MNRSFPAYLRHYLDQFTSLTPDSLDDLCSCFSPHARFKDPFNDVQGVHAIRVIFEHMFETTHDPRFIIRHAAVDHDTQTISASLSDASSNATSNDQTNQTNTSVEHLLIIWTFRCLTLKQRPIRIEGSSLVSFCTSGDDAGKVTQHIDYWDPVEHLYRHVPLLGKSLEWLGSRFSAAKYNNRKRV